jgi:hypothetical protein
MVDIYIQHRHRFFPQVFEASVSQDYITILNTIKKINLGFGGQIGVIRV